MADDKLKIPEPELRTPNSQGFTLIETIITLVVLSIAAVGVLSVFTVGTRGSANPLIMSQAMQLAQGELDTVIGIKMANGFSDTTLNTNLGQACKTASSLLPDFTCSLDICFVAPSNLDDTGNCGVSTEYKRVAATITHTPTGQSVTVVTLLANY